MKLFQLNFVSLIIRFYLMMAIVIVAFFAGVPWLAMLALPVFLSAMMGIQFTKVNRSAEFKPDTQTSTLYAPHQAAHS